MEIPSSSCLLYTSNVYKRQGFRRSTRPVSYTHLMCIRDRVSGDRRGLSLIHI
ncbi:hypothetical protein [Burkholderia plantarii]|uniref:hypothetical protein n=1 Tax=Burkholderia plantarii TaxID=41899 RepID=UPI0014960C19|nr:hypothetical protein [Burkholderia plantarii]